MIRKLFCLLLILSLSPAAIYAQLQETLTNKVYEVKYKPAAEIAKLLVGYDSEINPREQITLVPGSVNVAFNTFTVRAYPEGHAIVENIIRKYDVPQKTIEFQFFLVKASTEGKGLKDGVPDKVQKALKDIASLTRYKGFELIDAPLIRTEEGVGSASLEGKGVYGYSLRIISPELVVDGNKRQINIQRFMAEFRITALDSEGKSVSMPIRLDTQFNITEGEIVVLGASQIEREGKDSSSTAIITVVTAEVTTSAFAGAGDINRDLLKAAEKGDVDEIQLLFDNGADVDAKDGRGQSALYVAAKNGHLNAVRLLIKEGADQIDVFDDLENALREAARKGEIEKLQCLLEAGVNPNAAKKGSSTALILAAEEGHWDAVKLIIEHGGRGGYLILKDERDFDIQNNLDQALAMGFRILRTSDNCGKDNEDFIRPCALLEHSDSKHGSPRWNAPPFASMQEELERISAEGFRVLPNVIEKDPGQRFLYLIDSDSSRLQEKLDQASGMGFRVRMISYLSNQKGNNDIAILLEHSNENDAFHEYYIFKHYGSTLYGNSLRTDNDYLLFLQDDLNKVAEKGYRVVQNSLITEFTYRSRGALYDERSVTDICLLEKDNQTTKHYKYKIPRIYLFTGTGKDFYLEADRRTIAEAYEEGYKIVSSEPSILMEKEIDSNQ